MIINLKIKFIPVYYLIPIINFFLNILIKNFDVCPYLINSCDIIILLSLTFNMLL